MGMESSAEDFEAAYLGATQDIEVARACLAAMQQVVADGGRIIVGTEGALPIGAEMIRVEFGTARIKRRATRDEFVRYAPNKELAVVRAPFYYELEIASRVVQ